MFYREHIYIYMYVFKRQFFNLILSKFVMDLKLDEDADLEIQN